MDYKDLRIVFMGTPEFAVASLQKLLQAGCNIVGVITSPDKPAGRGMQLQESAVKKFAQQQGLLILQPEKLKSTSFLEMLQSLNADLQVVVAFRMLPEVVWSLPAYGTINLHGSLLPQYRGAAPINWAIINGEKFTGVTTFKLKHDIDTGNLLLSEKIEIQDNDTAETLHNKMKEIGADLLLQTVMQLANAEISEVEQKELPEKERKHAPKIFTTTCEINWNNVAHEIYNFIRGLSPMPGAYTYLDQKKVKIFVAEKEISNSIQKPGEYDTDNKTYLKYKCKDGYIKIVELQMEGKKRMSVIDFLRGYKFSSS